MEDGRGDDIEIRGVGKGLMMEFLTGESLVRSRQMRICSEFPVFHRCSISVWGFFVVVLVESQVAQCIRWLCFANCCMTKRVLTKASRCSVLFFWVLRRSSKLFHLVFCFSRFLRTVKPDFVKLSNILP